MRWRPDTGPPRIETAGSSSGAMTDDTDRGEHVCEACGKSFESEEALDHHVREVGIVD